jgi:SSS family solute:Na+ symporter
LPRDAALPAMLSAIPLAAGGLALAAVFSAELSAADAVLFMLSTSGGRDLYKAFIRPHASDAELLRAARISALIGGTLGYSLTFIFGTVLTSLKLFYAVLVVSLFVPILGGLYLPRAGSRAAFASIVVGITVLIGAYIITAGHGYAWMSPTLIGLVASACTYVLLAVVNS